MESCNRVNSTWMLGVVRFQLVHTKIRLAPKTVKATVFRVFDCLYGVRTRILRLLEKPELEQVFFSHQGFEQARPGNLKKDLVR